MTAKTSITQIMTAIEVTVKHPIYGLFGFSSGAFVLPMTSKLELKNIITLLQVRLLITLSQKMF